MTALQCATTLILARHGEAEYEIKEWADEGGSLTPLGRHQAAALGESLVGRRVAHVWTSTSRGPSRPARSPPHGWTWG